MDSKDGTTTMTMMTHGGDDDGYDNHAATTTMPTQGDGWPYATISHLLLHS